MNYICTEPQFLMRASSAQDRRSDTDDVCKELSLDNVDEKEHAYGRRCFRGVRE